MASVSDLDTSSSRYTVFSTKLQPPRLRTPLVVRSRLIDVFGFLPHVKLAVVSAPAGFGKTTLVGQAVQQMHWKAAWLSLDESDNHPVRFWFCVLQSLRFVQPSLEPLTSDIPQIETPRRFDRWLAGFVSELDRSMETLVLILDDYHLIENTRIHQGMIRLLQRMPHHFHLILTTRVEPPFPLARLRANRELLELNTEDLRFQTDETIAFLREVEALAINDRDVDQLAQQTEGWIAGLQLAALYWREIGRESQKRLNFDGSHAFVADYLTEEVIAHLPNELRQFLMETSILGCLTADLCNVVTGRTDSQEILELLERANIFLYRLQGEPKWYRYHRLFAEFLLQRLNQSVGDKVTTLHQRAAAWYIHHHYDEQAVMHYLAVDDFDRAAERLVPATKGLLLRGEMAVLQRWLQALPAEQIEHHPELRLVNAWVCLFSGQVEQAENHLNVYKAQPYISSSSLRQQIHQGEILTIQSEIARLQGKAFQAVAYAQEALKQLPLDDHFRRGILNINLGYLHWTSGDLDAVHETFSGMRTQGQSEDERLFDWIAQNNLARLQAVKGNLRRARMLFEDTLAEIEQANPVFQPIAGLSYLGLAALAYQWNRLDEAAQQVHTGLKCGRPWMYVKSVLSGYFLLSLIYLAQGNQTDPHTPLDDVEPLIKQSGLLPMHRRWWAVKARIALAENDIPQAEYWLQQISLPLNGQPGYDDEFEYFTLIQMRIAQSRSSEVITILEYLTRLAERQGRICSQIDALGWLAVVWHTRREPERALDSLSRAVHLGQRESFAQVFLEKGERMAELLVKLQSRTKARIYVEHLLMLFSEPSTSMSLNGSKLYLVEPLTEREQEVLGLLALGLRDHEIAARLHLSKATVKTHNHHILRKLDARNRTEAVVKARQLSLLTGS
jgi:LuxR family maltose regulon positive regulatory protein